MLRTLSVFVFAALLPAANPPGGDLQATLARLDAASARFTSAEAKVHRDAYNALIKDTDQQDGSLYVIRGKDGKTQLGIRTDGANARIVEYKDGTLRDFIPASKCYNTVNKPGIDTFLSIGFGGSGRDLAKAWEITDQGSETMAGAKVEKLDLVPRDSNVKANVTHLTLWVDLERDVTLKQIFYAPTGDTNTAIYSDIQLNKSIKTGPYAIKGNSCG